jgi:transposase
MGKTLKVGGPATPAEVKAAFRASQERHDRERLQAVMLGQQGQWTLAEIAQALSRGRATIATWIGVYRQEGLESLLRRRHVGRGAKVADADREAWQEGLRQGKWKTAKEIQRWLKRERGIELTVWGVYYWLYQLQGSWKVPRKSHIKKLWGSRRVSARARIKVGAVGSASGATRSYLVGR